MKRLIFISLLALAFFSCNQDKSRMDYELTPVSKRIEIPIDDNTKLFTRAMHHFVDTTGVEYLTIENSENTDDYNYINFYRLDSCKLAYKIKIAKEGANGIPRFMGHGILDLNNIFVSAFGTSFIYQIDKEGNIKKRYDYRTTEEENPTTSTDFNTLIYKPLIIKDHKIYCMQYPMPPNCNKEQLTQTPLTITIDTLTQKVETQKLCYPALWSRGNGMGLNPHCSRIYDGKQFIYAFRMSHDIIVTKDHIESKHIRAKSQYIDELQTEGFSNKLSFEEFNKLASEQATYGNIVYDKYRDVYYRFAYPECEVNSTSFEYIFCRKEFSIIILDNEFNIIGETLFPAGKYAPGLFFVNQDGLYLSLNNTENPEIGDDELVFQCLELRNTKANK